MTEERMLELARVTRRICNNLSEDDALTLGSVVGELILEIRRLQQVINKLTTEDWEHGGVS